MDIVDIFPIVFFANFLLMVNRNSIFYHLSLSTSPVFENRLKTQMEISELFRDSQSLNLCFGLWIDYYFYYNHTKLAERSPPSAFISKVIWI